MVITTLSMWPASELARLVPSKNLKVMDSVMVAGRQRDVAFILQHFVEFKHKSKIMLVMAVSLKTK